MYISKVEICTIVMCNLVALSSLTDRCSPEYCNFAGECKVVEKQPICSCYEEAFLGKYCEQVKNLCEAEKNNCTANQICVPYVGHTICDCPPKRGGSDSCEQPAPTKLMCNYNVRAVYGIVEQIVLSFEQLGPESLQITISTPTYLIAHVPRSGTASSQYTNNLTAILQELGIRRHMKLPYNSGHYYVFHAKHFTLGPNQLTVTVGSFGKGNQSKPASQALSLIVHVVQPRHHICLPRIVFQHGMDPMKPSQLDIERFNNIQAIVEKRCSPADLRMRAKWTIYNGNESLLIFSTQVVEHLLLKIPRYRLWHRNVLSLYPNVLLTVQLALKEGDSPWVYERCYINLTARNVVAHIAGAHYKEVNDNSKWLILDGSKSREPAINLCEPKPLTFTWILSSADGSNKEYLSLESSNPKLNISTTILKRGEKNLITLTVANKIVKARKSTISQVIVLTSNKNQLSVDIDCIRNCDGNVYASEQVLHLRAVCHACSKPVSYTWTIKDVNVQQNKQRLVTKLAADLIGEIVVKLDIKTQFGKGYTELRLQGSRPPAGGNCEIEPKNGLECLTKFQIRCQNFSSLLQEPLWYTFKTGAIYEDSTKSGETFLYLHGNAPLTVHICNSHFQCTIVNIAFTVLSLKSSKTVHNLASMLIAGQRQQAFCLLQTVSSSPENIAAVLEFFQSIKFDRAPTVLEMVNTLEIAHKTISHVGSLESNEARAIPYILERVIESFDFVRNDTEILDMSEEICLDLGKVITNVVTYCMEINTKLLKQSLIIWESDNPFSENYVDWLSLDSEIALRISRYSEIVNLIFKIWQRIGEESTRYIQPEEPFEYLSKNVSYRLEMHDNHGPIKYSSSCESCQLIVPASEVVALRKMLGTKYLLIYAWCFQTNIFWWVPAGKPPSTALLAVNIHGRNAPHKLETKLNQKYSLSLRRVENTTDFYHNQTDVIFQNMLVYKLKLPGQVNLIVHFISCTAALRVLITMNMEPTLDHLHDRSCFVPKECSKSIIILKNRCTEEGMAYIAVYKANSNETEPVRYTFRLSAQECNVWGIRNNYPNWVKQGCYSQNLIRSSTLAQCQFNRLSVFSAREYEIELLPIKKIRIYDFIPSLNIGYVIFNCLLCIGALSLLIMGALRLRHTNANLIRVIKWDKVDPETENVIVHLHTGGNFLASTTGNINLVFISDLGRYKVVIHQNPISPLLDLNTSCILRLSDKKVQLPCRLIISHDFTGRYPTWYCRSVQVDDLRWNLSFTFDIHSWIRRDEKIIVSCLPAEKQSIKNRLHQAKEEQGSWRRFKHSFRYYSQYYYTNWFMLQPILGPWRYSDESFNIYERTCIWICKTALTVTMVFCYYGYSSAQHFIEFKQQLTLTNTSEFLAIAIGSYIATTICDLCLIHLILTLSNS